MIRWEIRGFEMACEWLTYCEIARPEVVALQGAGGEGKRPSLEGSTFCDLVRQCRRRAFWAIEKVSSRTALIASSRAKLTRN
jgi:hypothetical protein